MATSKKRGVTKKLTPRQINARIREYEKIAKTVTMTVEYYGLTCRDELDQAIQLLAGKRCDGTGYDFSTETRDVGFSFDFSSEAFRAKQRILRCLKVRVRTWSNAKMAKECIAQLRALK